MRRFAIILSESKPDLIRRMCAELHYEIETLMRTRILTLKMISTYPIGSWRKLTESEIEDLKTVGIVVSENQNNQNQCRTTKEKNYSKTKTIVVIKNIVCAQTMLFV